MILYTIFN